MHVDVVLRPIGGMLQGVKGALEDIVQEDNRASEVIQRPRGLLKKGESRSASIDL